MTWSDLAGVVKHYVVPASGGTWSVLGNGPLDALPWVGVYLLLLAAAPAAMAVGRLLTRLIDRIQET